MWYREGAGVFGLHKWHSCTDIYWLDSTVILFIRSISSRLKFFCIKQEDRRLSLKQQTHKDESLTACAFVLAWFYLYFLVLDDWYFYDVINKDTILL